MKKTSSNKVVGRRKIIKAAAAAGANGTMNPLQLEYLRVLQLCACRCRCCLAHPAGRPQSPARPQRPDDCWPAAALRCPGCALWPVASLAWLSSRECRMLLSCLLLDGGWQSVWLAGWLAGGNL